MSLVVPLTSKELAPKGNLPYCFEVAIGIRLLYRIHLTAGEDDTIMLTLTGTDEYIDCGVLTKSIPRLKILEDMTSFLIDTLNLYKIVDGIENNKFLKDCVLNAQKYIERKVKENEESIIKLVYFRGSLGTEEDAYYLPKLHYEFNIIRATKENGEYIFKPFEEHLVGSESYVNINKVISNILSEF